MHHRLEQNYNGNGDETANEEVENVKEIAFKVLVYMEKELGKYWVKTWLGRREDGVSG